MEISNTLYVTSRSEWRQWLAANHQTAKDIWLIYYRKGSGKPRIPYNEAVEEALCFGWIDSTVKGIDEEKYAQRFSPRNSKSGYSQANRERLRRLIDEGKVMPEVQATVGDLSEKDFRIPDDILEAIKANASAWKNFRGFSESYQRIRIAYINGSRGRPREFHKRLAYFLKMTAENKQFGFGIKDYFTENPAD
jgi:uncharacterized protein YdeI (YjbR/CyaY-like superfamily)